MSCNCGVTNRGIGNVPGPAGPKGLSAFEVAVANGFVGTEQEWLESLQGGLDLSTVWQVDENGTTAIEIVHPDVLPQGQVFPYPTLDLSSTMIEESWHTPPRLFEMVRRLRWDNVGNFSVAIVRPNEAPEIDQTGRGNTQFGGRAIQSGWHNLQVGSQVTQSGSYNAQVAFVSSQSSYRSAQFGTDNSQPTGTGNLQVGGVNRQDGDWSVQGGYINTQSGGRNTQFGGRSTQSGSYGLQSGRQNTQSGRYGFQAGISNTQSGNSSLQVGSGGVQEAVASAQFGWNHNQSGSGSLQVGNRGIQSGNYNAQFGDRNTQSGYYGTQAGRQLNDGGFDSTFMVGIGKTAIVRRRAYFALDNGIWIQPTAGDAATPENGVIGYNSTLDKFRFFEGGEWNSHLSEDNPTFTGLLSSRPADRAFADPIVTTISIGGHVTTAPVGGVPGIFERRPLFEVDDNANIRQNQEFSRNLEPWSVSSQSGSQHVQAGSANAQAGFVNMQRAFGSTQSGSYNLQLGWSHFQSGSTNTQSGYNNTQSGQYGFQLGGAWGTGNGLDDGGFNYTFMIGRSKTAIVERRAYFALDNGIWIQPVAAAPAAPENGVIYYDSTTHKFRGFANGAWVDLH